ncbi:hypothetical protein VTL71DRAFT_13698 [Oculimacula yallundae]|uniref:Uncharacterized protein n=1 Tax=Oculimacula yallundae TaxID=86028 RepID=A0ABR4CL51_9HELO
MSGNKHISSSRSKVSAQKRPSSAPPNSPVLLGKSTKTTSTSSDISNPFSFGSSQSTSSTSTPSTSSNATTISGADYRDTEGHGSRNVIGNRDFQEITLRGVGAWTWENGK